MEETLYVVCAVAGCTIVVLQAALQVFGLFGEADLDGGHHDIHVDADGPDGHGNVLFGFLSFKALCAFAGIFGLVGMIMLQRGASFPARISVAMAGGVGGMLLVGWLMRGLSRLQASGTLDVRNAVGKTAIVYLRIPGRSGGRGKVTVEVQGRSIELPAVTGGEDIPTGTRVTVIAVEGDETLKVEAYR